MWEDNREWIFSLDEVLLSTDIFTRSEIEY